MIFNKFKKVLTLLFAIILNIANTTCVFAQSDRIGNGGNWTESDLKHFLVRLMPYLESVEGSNLFPEIKSFDSVHGAGTLSKIAKELNPRLVSKKVFDSRGNERDCISYTKPYRYFECNLDSLPPKPSVIADIKVKSEYYGSLYRLVLHELLVQAEIEKPLAREIPSEYLISSRLLVHLESFPEWVPGPPSNIVAQGTDIAIHTTPKWSIGAGAGRANDTFSLGIGLKLQFPIQVRENRFSFGFISGYQYGLSKMNPWAIPILATAEFEITDWGGISYYISAGAGVSVVKRVYNNFYNASFSFTDVDFTVQINPGISFGQNRSYFLEVPVSYLNLGFSIIPSLGIHF